MPEWNIYRDWLEETPRALYGALRPQAGSPSFLDYFRSSQGESRVWDDYWTRLGRMALGGQAPSLNPSDFLANYQYGQEYQKLSPSQRGAGAGQYGGRLRWNVR